ncbi:MAG: class I SAM-dependent methyltransferase [Gemmatimonadaceae bacterium]
MDERYITQYRHLYERHWWWRARERLLLHAIRRLVPNGVRARILDVGCGDGFFFDRLTAFGEVEGVDPAASGSGPWADRIHVAPFDHSFQPGRRYSLILFLDVLEHLDRPEEALCTAAMLLDEGGSVLVTVPAFPQLWTRHDDLNRHRARYTSRTLTEMLTRAGFVVSEARYFFHWLAAAKVVVRTWERIMPGGAALPTVPPSAINRALEFGSLWESRLLAPLHLPFGSSLLAVARPRRH